MRHSRKLILLSVLSLLMWLVLHNLMPHTNAHYVILQSRQDTCGSASIATLLNSYLSCPTSEQEMMRLSGYTPGNEASLLDLQRAVMQKQYGAASCKMTLPALQQQLKTYSTPVIVRFHSPSPHFSVLLGMDTDSCYLADPSLGNIMISTRDMAKMWLIPGEQAGYALVVSSAKGVNVGRVRQVIGEVRADAHRSPLQTWCAGWIRKMEYGF